MKRLPLISSVILFILVVVSGSFWTLQLVKPVARKVMAPQPVVALAQSSTVASLFGGSAVEVVSNFQLKGIVMANPADQSVAIIVADGKPAQAYPIHSEIQAGVTLNEVHGNYIMLVDNGVNKRVDLPKDAISSMDNQFNDVAIGAPGAASAGVPGGVSISSPGNAPGYAPSGASVSRGKNQPRLRSDDQSRNVNYGANARQNADRTESHPSGQPASPPPGILPVPNATDAVPPPMPAADAPGMARALVH